MKCVLFGLLVLGVCSDQILGKPGTPKAVQHRKSRSPSEDHEDVYSSIITAYVPTFLDQIDVGDISDKHQNQEIQFKNVKVSELSTAHSVTYRIGLVTRKVDVLLGFSKLQVKGSYTIGSSGAQNFVYNIYGHVALIQNISYSVENGKVLLTKGTPNLRYKKVKVDYSGAANLKFVSQNLLNAVTQKIDAEVRPKLSDGLSKHILKEDAFKLRRDSSIRIQKVLHECFDIVDTTYARKEPFGIFYQDNTTFSKTIENVDVKIPSFTLRGLERFALVSTQPSFSENGVFVKAVYNIPNPWVMIDVLYRKAKDDKAEYREAQVEYLLSNLKYVFDVSERSDQPIQLDQTTLSIDSIKVAPTQGLFGNELDKVIQALPEQINAYLCENAKVSVAEYVQAFFADIINKEKRLRLAAGQ